MPLPSALLCLLCLGLLASPAKADSPLGPAPVAGAARPASPTGSPLAELTNTLRSYILRKASGKTYETKHGWGHKKSGRNDGVWRDVHITAPNLADTLTLVVSNVQQPEQGHLLFDVLLGCDARIELEQQVWKEGVPLYSGTARARVHARVSLACELTTRLDWNAKLLPEGVFRLRVVHADLGYDHFVLEHVAGLGGSAAKLVGDLLKGILRHWHPSLEQEWLAKANTAIQKAADTKEIRIGVGSFLQPKGKP